MMTQRLSIELHKHGNLSYRGCAETSVGCHEGGMERKPSLRVVLTHMMPQPIDFALFMMMEMQTSLSSFGNMKLGRRMV